MKRIYGWHAFNPIDIGIWYREVADELTNDVIESMDGEWFLTFKEAKQQLNNKINQKITDWKKAKNYVKTICSDNVCEV